MKNGNNVQYFPATTNGGLDYNYDPEFGNYNHAYPAQAALLQQTLGASTPGTSDLVAFPVGNNPVNKAAVPHISQVNASDPDNHVAYWDYIA